jgi:hypothetical protein
MTTEEWLALQRAFIAIFLPVLQIVCVGNVAGLVLILLLTLGLTWLRRSFASGISW